MLIRGFRRPAICRNMTMATCLRVENVEFSLHALCTHIDVVISRGGSLLLSKMAETEYFIMIPVGLDVRSCCWEAGRAYLEGS